VAKEGVNQEDVFEAYLEQLKLDAEKKLKESCEAQGRVCEKGVTPPVTPPVTPTPQQDCEEKGFMSANDSCTDPSVLGQTVCESQSGDWIGNICNFDRSLCTTDGGSWSTSTKKCTYGTTPQPNQDYCGDRVCSSMETPIGCPIDCKVDLTCEPNESNIMYCPTGEQVVGEICVNGAFIDSGNSCPTVGTGGFYDDNKGAVWSVGGILLAILGAVFLL
jgi:hypothetical protein